MNQLKYWILNKNKILNDNNFNILIQNNNIIM